MAVPARFARRARTARDHTRKSASRAGPPAAGGSTMRSILTVVRVLGSARRKVRPGPPQQLSDEGLYDDIAGKHVAGDAIPLAPRYPLWSDGAAKQRWMRLPAGTTIDTSNMDHWRLPEGTRLYKEFVVDGKRVETRVIETTAGAPRFAVYAWLPDESDALPVPDGADAVNGTAHDIPSVELCVLCHQSEPGFSLGVSAIQLAAELPPARLPFADRLSDAPDRTFAIPGDATARAALGALHGNCGHCHTEGGLAAMQHLRVLASDADRPLTAIEPYATTVGVALSSWHDAGFKLRISPGNPDASAIAYRMSQRGLFAQMPPLGTDRLDGDGLAAVRAWIATL